MAPTPGDVFALIREDEGVTVGSGTGWAGIMHTVHSSLAAVGLTARVAGALVYSRYGWFKARMLRRIVAKNGGDTDMSRDYEYTDWAAIDRFADDVLAMRAGRHGATNSAE